MAPPVSDADLRAGIMQVVDRVLRGPGWADSERDLLTLARRVLDHVESDVKQQQLAEQVALRYQRRTTLQLRNVYPLGGDYVM